MADVLPVLSFASTPLDRLLVNPTVWIRNIPTMIRFTDCVSLLILATRPIAVDALLTKFVPLQIIL
jgi:hypothetical protein